MGINVKKKKSVFSELSVCPKKRDPDGYSGFALFNSKDWSLFLFEVVLAIEDGRWDILPAIRESSLSQMADDIAQIEDKVLNNLKAFFLFYYYSVDQRF